MEKQLEQLMSRLSPSEADEFAASFEAFGEDYISPDVQSRILSSVKRKAGSDMKENITVKKTRKHSKRFVGFAIAAAVFATSAIGAGAYAISQFANRESVLHYLGEQAPEKLEGLDLVLNNFSENEHVRVTLDTVLSDGKSAMAIFSVEQLDEAAHDLRGDLFPNILTFYADTGEQCNAFSGYGSFFEKDGFNDPNIGTKHSYTINISSVHADIDFSRKLKIKFFDLADPDVEQDLFRKYGGKKFFEGIEAEGVENLFEGIELEIDLSQNVDSVMLYAQDGRHLEMTPFAVRGSVDSLPAAYILPWGDESLPELNSENFFFIKADGTRETALDRFSGTFFDDDITCFELYYYHYCDLDDYIGVEICGVEYLKQ